MATIVNYCYISATSTPTTNTPISHSQDPSTPPTKIILPKKKPMKWSTGVAPGEYGGPPTTSKLRKYWGGEEDPLTSDDFIWNKEFMGRMKRLIQDPLDPSSFQSSAPVKEEPSGFLSLNRAMSLDSLEVDLSKDLILPSKTVVEQAVEASQASGSASRRWRPAPTRREQEKWDRATKAATGGSSSSGQNQEHGPPPPEPPSEPAGSSSCRSPPPSERTRPSNSSPTV